MPKIISSGRSDVGLKRSTNEDAFILKPAEGFLAVADGMGGEAAGEVASRIFIDSALTVFSQGESRSEQETLERVQDTFSLANEKISSHVKRHPEHEGMGCTAELFAFYHDHFILGHVGDSRTYLLRQGRLRQLTKDHSLIQDQINQGLISPVEARRHSLRNVILRAVGADETLSIDLVRGECVPGDLFLLCSDGLTNLVEDASIQGVLSSPLELPQKVERLIQMAKSAGGYDNITVILGEVISS